MIDNFDKLSESDQVIFNIEIVKCDNCKSFKDCKQSVKGYKPVITYDEIFNKYRVSNTKCEKMQGATNTPLIREIKYKTFEADNKQEMMDHLNKYKTLYVYGPPGIGKTHLLFYIANAYNEIGNDVYINLFQNCIREIKEALSKYDKYDRESNTQSLIKTLQEVDVLCLDDVGNEKSTAWTLLEVLQAVIDYRYLHKKITIVSSNHTTAQLYNIYKNTKDVHSTQIAPIISRLKDFGEIEFKGKYWRKI
jgi:DNA replication protein DnaC